jgi:diketogulonate reductase-like aldo/keto reductase
VRRIAASLGKTPAQILIRWALESAMVPLPKSTNAARIAENFDVFRWALDEASRSALDALEEGLVTGWDPRSAP